VLFLSLTSLYSCLMLSALFANTWRPLVSVVTTLLCCDYFSSSSVVSRAFSAVSVYSNFRHHLRPLGYLCAKFRFFLSLHCWTSLWRKIAYTQSLTQSLTQLISCPSEPKRLRFGTWHQQNIKLNLHLFDLWPICYTTNRQ